MKLCGHDRLYMMLMISRGRQGDRYAEKSLLDFFEHAPLRAEALAVRAWRVIGGEVGDAQLPYLRLDAEQSRAMGNRFTSFFRLSPNDPSLARVFGDSFGREPTASELNALQQFWRNDLRQFARWLEDTTNQDTLSRMTIYDEYMRPKTPSEFVESVRPEAGGMAAGMEERRHRRRIPCKLMTDLADNANVPATLNIKSFVPPDMPDPVRLPMNFFQAVQLPNPALDAHGDAVRQAYAELLARRVEAGEQFFYDSQTFERLPDIGSFTLRDTVTVME